MLKRILLRVYERTKQQTAVDSTRWICVDVIVKIPKCGILLYVTKVRTISCKVCGFSYVQMYEWALATMRCLSTVNGHDARRSPRTEVDAAALSQLQLFVDARPSPLTVEAERDMVDILARINNPALDDLWATARQRYVHTSQQVTRSSSTTPIFADLLDNLSWIFCRLSICCGSCCTTSCTACSVLCKFTNPQQIAVSAAGA